MRTSMFPPFSSLVVTLSEAKGLYRYFPIGVKLSNHYPTPGRPQGSQPSSSPLPPLQRPVAAFHPSRRLCKGGSGVVRSGDPCGRPGEGRRPATYVNLTLIGSPSLFPPFSLRLSP